jgi:L-xylulose reductase
MHPVDSNDISFQIAGCWAFKEAFLRHGPVCWSRSRRIENGYSAGLKGERSWTLNMKLPETFHFDFNQKRVLVTGAGKGIGREIATMLHRFNAQVVALSRTETDLLSLQNEIGCETIIAELGDAGSARRAAEQAGEIDLLVNNAAIAILESFLKTTAEAWDKTMAVNLRAVMIVSQVVASQMIERGVAGSIVNVSSMASFQALHDHAAYCASKQ